MTATPEKQQNVFAIQGDTVIPGSGWSTFANLFRATETCDVLGETVGIAVLQLPQATQATVEIARLFARAADPPLSDAHEQSLHFGLKRVLLENGVTIDTGSRI